MATYKSFNENSLSSTDSTLKCDICGSHNIIETREGYVCHDCGIELKIQKLQYDKPYNEDLIQYAKGLGRTQIGTRRERVSSPRSIRLQRLNKYNSIVTSKKSILESARSEINRLFGALNLSEYIDIKEMVLEKFKRVHSEIRTGSKYRNIEKLVSILIYICLKLRNVSINLNKLIDSAKITRKEFNDFILQLRRYLPEYDGRNRQSYILQRISEVMQCFDLGMPLYFLSKKILYRLWQVIKNTTDDVIAGLVSSIAVLCTCKEKVSISSICNRLGIRMSTIQAQVKKNLFDRFKVKGFTTLVKSSKVLIIIMEKLDILKPQESELEENQKCTPSEGNVELVLGNAKEIFNVHNKKDYYYFAIRENNTVPLGISIKINKSPLSYIDQKQTEIYHKPLMEFIIHQYYREKDPPSF
ncbi:MAG: hypothetical protein ACFFCE_19450 [Promethearchaeota archaeon]